MSLMNVFDLSAKLTLDKSEYDSGLQSAAGKAADFGDILKANLISAVVEKGMNLLVSGLQKIGNAIEQNMGTAVSRLDTLNSYGKTMQALGFSIDDANEAQARLSDAIDGLPTTLDGIISWQQQFTALSDDIQGSTDLTIALNNATLAAGKGQEAANNAMANWYSIISAGAPDAQHWQSLYSTMPAQMNQLAEAVLGAGAKSDDLFQAWKSGAVTTEDVTSALVALNEEGINGVASFADQAQIGAQTIETAYGNINTAIGKNIAKVLDVINGDTTAGGGRIVELLLNVKNLINEIGTTIADFTAEHEPEITAIMDALNALFKGEGDLKTNLETILDNVGSVLGDVVNRLAEALPTVITFGGNVVGTLAQGLLDHADEILNAGLQLCLTLITGFAENSQQITYTIVSLVATIVMTIQQPEVLVPLAQAGLLIIQGIIMGLAQASPQLFALIPNAVATMIETFLSLRPDILNAIAGVLEAIVIMVIGAVVGLSGQTYDTVLGGFDAIKYACDNFFNTLFAVFSGGITTLANWVASGIAGWVNLFTNGFNNMQTTATTILNSIAGTFNSIFETIKSTVENGINYVKGLFNFEWSLPDIKLPHFSVKGTLDLLATPPTYPTVSVSWYRKAMEQPYLLDGATIFGAAGGKLLGGGESGSELVVGTDKLMNMMRDAMGVESRPITINVYGAEGQDVRTLAKEVSRELENLMRDKEAAYGM